MNKEVLEWFDNKGITPETIKQFHIQTTEDGGVAFPYTTDKHKVRYGIPNGERRFTWPKDTPAMLFNIGDVSKRNIILCEGETDTMRLRQELNGDESVGVVGIPGVSTWNAGMADDLSQAEQVFVILDNDTDYNVTKQVDDGYRQIRRDLGNKAKRVYLPKGVNDLCDFFLNYSLESLRMLIERQPRPGESRFRTLDLTKEPPEPNWIIKDLICGGDINLIIGEPGIGKSWITMGMSTAIAKCSPEFLGFPIVNPGRVLYFDEENPEDLIFHRFIKLGLDRKSADNIRFINNLGIRLDHDPSRVIDEALDFSPSLVVLDSLTRFHGQEENSAGAMADLFNSAIKPLARESGAAVVLVHHANKTDSSSSYRRARGSGDITASVDAAYDIFPVDGGLAIKSFKSRRAAQGKTHYVSIVNTKDGGVELIGMTGISGIF